ncbi:ABC transporter ATP-binding protein [Vitiosangium sp. GDMCC 1.1324]|uniref:ABC transporter ATP-binding protein n=1 Tax=Vitiosangium sp. (strain GDMCC 1.1324) TaxID=2138576 RepID=UPI000D37E283|nr:ABC transporter ATP-binding protein [Vitiosangium sp. GDMCC 1.1324]PTL83035.1 ABC transporter ATP-binding protein [Vitiosangium sp. GDMCC 1.1324]
MSTAPVEAASPFIRLRGVSKAYRRGDIVVPVLEEVNLDIEAGTFEAFMGPSGSGKSTLLNLISGLDRPSTGVVEVGGQDLARMSDKELADWRAGHVGFVFQMYNLLPVLTAAENVELPLLLTPLSRSERREHVAAALEVVGLSHRMSHRPSQLSGGEQQRVAIARAIVTDPDLLIADEPTGDLDRKSAEQVLDLFQELHHELHKTLVMVTHDPHAAEWADLVRHLEKGVLQ